MNRRLLAAALGFLLALDPLWAVPSAMASVTFTVNRTDDARDAKLNDGLCDVELNVAGSQCTLRAAIQQANKAPGRDTITVPAGVFKLTRTGRDEDKGLTGDLDITQDLTVNGAGQTNTFIDGGDVDRVFHIVGGKNVSIARVSIRNGDEDRVRGGAIYNDGGTLTVVKSIINGNTALDGGGIKSSDTNGPASLPLIDSTVRNNSSSFVGGGLASRGGALTLINSTVRNNITEHSGGGIINDFGSRLTITNSVIRNNEAGDRGGGILNQGSLQITGSAIRDNVGGGLVHSQGAGTLVDSKVVGNRSDSSGAGILNDSNGVLTLSRVTVSGNRAAFSGGGLFNNATSRTLTLLNSEVVDNTAVHDGGGVFVNVGEVVLVSSVVRGNDAANDGGGVYNRNILTLVNTSVISNTSASGGGLFNTVSGGATSSVARLTNSTLSGNQATASGGGIFNDRGVVSLHNVTLAANSADSDGNRSGNGGGIATTEGAVNFRNTIVAGNQDLSPRTAILRHPDCSGTLVSQDYNLVQRTSGCTIGGTTTHNLQNIDPRLGPLEDNGSPTLTHALASNSPAIDTANPGGCRAIDDSILLTDQRGLNRLVDGDSVDGRICDRGALEFDPRFDP